MNAPKTKTLNIRLDEETADLLRRLAEQERETVSNYLRRLIWKQETPKDVVDTIREQLSQVSQ